MKLQANTGWSYGWTMLIATLWLLGAGAAFGQVICDESVRDQFQQAVADGVSEDELEQSFGHCRFDDDEDPACEDPTLTTPADKTISFPLNGNVRFERMRRCGYHPKNEDASCEVEIRRRNGYGAMPTGSDEYVLFCFDCNRDGIYDFRTLGSVHVNDDVSGSNPSWYYSVSGNTQPARAACTNDDGGATNVRAILSWGQVPRRCRPARPPIFGNVIDFTARRDP